MKRLTIFLEGICPVCKKKFNKKYAQQTYCSIECRKCLEPVYSWKCSCGHLNILKYNPLQNIAMLNQEVCGKCNRSRLELQ